MRNLMIIIAFLLGRWPSKPAKDEKIVSLTIYYDLQRKKYTLGVMSPQTGKTELTEINLTDTELFGLIHRQAVAMVADYHSERWN